MFRQDGLDLGLSNRVGGLDEVPLQASVELIDGMM